jgi:hypothetical protein
MRRTAVLVVTVGVGAGLTLVAGGQPASGAAKNTIAYWQMNESAGATVMVDSGPNHINGSIGDLVSTGGSYQGATGYDWSYTPPNTPPAQPERLVQVNSSLLNPGNDEYSVTVRYRTTHKFGNILQKGQATAKGGQVKIELPGGRVTCLFKGSIQRRAITSDITINDGNWHTITCERNKANVTLRIDDDYVRRIAGWTGEIANTWPMTIGGKPQCDQDKVTCDYFVGQIDWVRIQGGGSSTPPPPTPPPTPTPAPPPTPTPTPTPTPPPTTTPPVEPTLSAPGKVSGLKVKGKKRADHRKVKWSAPTVDGGAVITKYKVVVRHKGDKVLKVKVAAPTLKVKLARASLPTGKDYVVVKAKNSVGWGAQAKTGFKVR